MCLIFLSINHHPAYKLVIAANRDEFYERETAPADFWQTHPNILGGRDLKAHGTWLAMTTAGKISLLTNYRDPANIDPLAPSRGKLVSDFLEFETPAAAYLQGLEKAGKSYNGFNLLAGTVDELLYYSNYAPDVRILSPGSYGLSNHLLDTPWPKVERGKKGFDLLLQKNNVKPEALFEFLYDDRAAPDDQLPDTGIGLERERALSSMFIKTPNYGSRCSTVIMVDHYNNVLFAERVYDLKTFEYSLRTYEFKVEGRTA
jgi:uncharacterized protein with NRDE domain